MDAAPDASHSAATAVDGALVPTLRVVTSASASARRAMNMSHLLNGDGAGSEVDAGSDCEPPSLADDTADDRTATPGGQDAAAALLLSFTRGGGATDAADAASPIRENKPTSEQTEDSTADVVVGDGIESMKRDATVTTANGSTTEAPAAEKAPPVDTAAGGRAPRRGRAPPKPKAKKATPAKKKKTKAPPGSVEIPGAVGDTVVGETPPPAESPQAAPAREPAAMEVEVDAAASTTPPAATTPSTRPVRAAREKRRPPPPALVQPTAPKKPKTSASARPKRVAATAVTNYVDVTASDGEDSEASDASAVMVISNAKPKAKAPPAEVTPVTGVVVPAPRSIRATGPPVKVNKRKHMSKRQFDELMADDRAAGSSSPGMDFAGVSDVVLIAAVPTPTPATTPSVLLHPCEFCRKRHSAHPTFVCRSCRRAYHDKCFVETFKPEIHDDEPIEDQMERLSLHRPQGRSAILRCASCQAAFIDFCKNRGVHWDCACPTCTSMPEKIADYRRVSLKRIIDEHNLEHALKKEKKGTAGSTKGGAGKAAEKTPPPKSGAKKRAAPPAEASVPKPPAPTRTRGQGGRRTRGEEAASSEDMADSTINIAPPTTPVPAQATESESAPKPEPKSKRAPPARARRARGKPVPVNLLEADESDENPGQVDAVAMEVDQEGTDVVIQSSLPVVTSSLPNGSNDTSSEPSKAEPSKAKPSTTNSRNDLKMQAPSDESESEKVTYEDLEKLVAITKENEDTWSFRVACSSSRKSNESGMYKEAILYWHPKRHTSLKCSCCDRIGESMQWFVQHTDPSLLSELDASDSQRDVYSYLFVLQRNGHMVPLQKVTSIIRKKHNDTVKQQQAKQSRQNGSRRSSGSAAKKESNSGRHEALALLRDVKFIVKPDVDDRGPGKRRGSATHTKYACEVLCAEQGKWLKPLTANETVLRNMMADSSFVVDTCKTGIFDISESAKNPKTCKILCTCCNETFNAKDFVHHTRKPLLDEQMREADEDKSRRRNEENREDGWHNDHDDHIDGDASTSQPQEGEKVSGTQNGMKILPFVCVAGVPLRDPLTALRLDTLLGALDKLGNQADINKTIASIVKSQETAVAVSL